MTRSALMSGDFGEHNGLPVSIIATVELTDLQAQTGVATTGGGSWLPITDAIRMAADAHHYLLLFDKAKPGALYKGPTTRCANAAPTPTGTPKKCCPTKTTTTKTTTTKATVAENVWVS